MRFRKAVNFALRHSPSQSANRLKAEIHPLKSSVKYAPCGLTIDITTACNLNCPWCSTKEYRKQGSAISLKLYQTILNKFKKATYVSLSGSGEPFLHRDLFEMAKYAKQLKMKVLISSNGTLLHQRMDEVLSANIHKLEISLKGICDEDYQRVMRGNEYRFDTILSAVRELSKLPNRPRIEVSYVCNRHNVDDIPRVIGIAQNSGADELSFYNMIPDPVLRNESDCLFQTDTRRVSEIMKSSVKKNDELIINGPGFYSHDTACRKCKRPFQTLRIGHDGGVSGCGRAITPSLHNGNAVLDNNVFNAEHFRALRSEHLDKRLSLRYECIFCDNRL